MGEISIPTVETLPTTETPRVHLMAVLCAAAEHGGLMKKEKEKKVDG